MQLVLGTAPASGAPTRRPRRVGGTHMESPNSELLWPPPNVSGEGASHNARGGRAPLPLHRYGLASSLFNCGSMEEEDYVRVLHAIDEFLAVKELAGRPVDVSVLKEFGLIDNEERYTPAFQEFAPRNCPQILGGRRICGGHRPWPTPSRWRRRQGWSDESTP